VLDLFEKVVKRGLSCSSFSNNLAMCCWNWR